MRRRPAYVWPRIVAHRGAGIHAPENTLAALRTCLEFGLRAVEFDVMLSADGIPVLMHDPQLGRTVAGREWVSALSAADLCRRDAGSWFGPQFAGEPVPRYEDVVRFCLANDIWMDVEIKPVPGYEAATGATVAQVTSSLCADPARLCFSSFSTIALGAARDVASHWVRRLLVEQIPPDWPSRLAAVGAVAIDCDHGVLDAARVAQFKAAGLGVFCYTVNDPARARLLFDWGVDALCTDRLDLFRDFSA